MEREPRVRTRIVDGGRFWAAWFRAPRRVGAVAPSSLRLALAMAREVPAGRGLVVELGAGTGSITAGLLRAGGIEARSLVVVERDPALARRLERRFPGCIVLCGDACGLPELLEQHGIREPVKAVVSSLPLLAMAPAHRARLIRGVRKLIRGGGAMVQYTYGVRCPVPRRTLACGGVRARRMSRVWRNLPPASVWRFENLPDRATDP